MANILQEIFIDEIPEKTISIKYNDSEDHASFIQAIERAWENGETEEISGECSIEETLIDSGNSYSIGKHKVDLVKVVPISQDFPYEFESDEGKEKIAFTRISKKNGIILETGSSDIVYLKMDIDFKSETINLTYKTQPNIANNISEIVQKYKTILMFLKYLFSKKDSMNSEKTEKISELIDYFKESHGFFNKLEQLECELNISIKPSEGFGSQSDWEEVDEMYLLLIKNKPIRLNRKITESEVQFGQIGDKNFKIEKGTKIDITFIGKQEYSLLGNRVLLHTANLVTNAIIREIEPKDDGESIIRFDDTDSHPMYIAYTAFKSEEEAIIELNLIMDKVDQYKEAKTLYEYLHDEYKTTKS